ncbi:hypothetical protein AMECASPLE_030273 [Ameca splendens]|uniref:Secreted protein n=1 Tax=Ameca splendens TaxID=208324 RepID=A0ABV0YT00_9TELE
MWVQGLLLYALMRSRAVAKVTQDRCLDVAACYVVEGSMPEVGAVCSAHALLMCLHWLSGDGALLLGFAPVGRGFMAFVFRVALWGVSSWGSWGVKDSWG